MKSQTINKTIIGPFAAAMLATASQAEVTLSDFSNFNLTGTYVVWDSGTFTPGATAFTVQANDFGGGFKNLPAPINASGNDTINIRLNVNAGNLANKFNLVLVDGDGTERVFRFDGITVGDNQTLTKNLASFLQDNNPGTTPGLNLANLTAFHIQGTFENGNPGQLMNMTFDNLAFVVAPFVPDTIVNGDFETAGGAGWGTTQGTPAFPTTGGNPNGHTQLDGTAGFAVLYAFNNAEKTFASLGLAPGDTYTFQMDMKLISGSNIGGLRLEGPAGYVIESYPPVIGDGTQWATYSIELTVPASPAQAKFGLRPGGDSVVAFDNVRIVLPAPAGPLQAMLTTGTTVSWTATSAVNRYQPQESSNGTTWTNLGPPVIGNAASAVFDDSKSPFYQVLESVPAVKEVVYNANFTEEGFDEDEAEGWNPVQSQWPTRLATGGRNDNGPCMQIQVFNSGSDANGSEIQQNTKNVDPVNGVITPGNTYDFSFWARQISSGVSYVQQYKVSWLDDSGAIMGDGGVKAFSATVGTWTQITQPGLVAPAGATTALIQILGVTGAVEGGLGEVLIDDVSLLSSGFGTPNVPPLAATATPTVEISWQSKTGQDYQVQSSSNLTGWSNFGGVVPGDGSIKAVYDSMVDPKKFYRVGELP